MTAYFLDSSALVKRYIGEVGSSWVQNITLPSSGNRIFVSQITQIEVMSAVIRRQREQFLSTRTERAIRLHLERHTRREYNVLPFSFAVNERTQDVLEAHILRASDALQLATALEIWNRLKPTGIAFIFVSADTRLLTAATKEGLSFDDPNQHP
jgi:uncharacterized protein